MSNSECSNTDINLDKVNRPECGEKTPTLRTPKNIQQFMQSGWVCLKYDCDMDKIGQIY